MSRHWLAAGAVLLAASCGSESPEKPAEPATTPASTSSPARPAPAQAAAPAQPVAAPPADSDYVTSGSMTLRFFDDVTESTQSRKPSFELHTPKYSMTEDNVWVLEDAVAVAYAADGSETRFKAGGGVFDDNTKTAQLTGGVTVDFGTQHVELQDMTWTNDTHVAASQNPVAVSDGETRLRAASMEYNADSKTLVLRGLNGVVSMKDDEQVSADGGFEFIDVAKGGTGEFVDGQLKQIGGGVEIALRSADPAAKPMRLTADKITFLWNDDSRVKPAQIQLAGGVGVDGPQGLISAARADLDLVGEQLVFSSNVTGSSESIESFDADRIVYDMKTGDSQMSNLVARGIKLGEGGGFSRMNIDRAGNVVSTGGRVNAMQGGVAITLQPDGAGKPLKLSASDATFAWSGDGTQPTGIALRGGVRVDGPQGAINAQRADFDLGKKQLAFAGNVTGQLPQLERFNADKLTYSMETGETLMTSVTAKGLALGAGAKPAEAEAKPEGYSTMDIESAPEVSITGQKLNWLRGGVALKMVPADPAKQPLTVRASEMTFAYASDSESNPREIQLEGDVRVEMPERNVSSDRAELDLATNTLTFSDNVLINAPESKEAEATQFTYNLTTGQTSMKGFKARSIRVASPEDEPKEAKP